MTYILGNLTRLGKMLPAGSTGDYSALLKKFGGESRELSDIELKSVIDSMPREDVVYDYSQWQRAQANPSSPMNTTPVTTTPETPAPITETPVTPPPATTSPPATTPPATLPDAVAPAANNVPVSLTNPYTPATTYAPEFTAQSFSDIMAEYLKAAGTYTPTTVDTLLKQYQAGDLAVMNPYTRGLMEYNAQQGQTPFTMTPEGRATEEARRVALLQQSVTQPAAANMGVALTEVQKQMQKAGKYSSSATTAAMMRTSEAYSADIAGKMAAGTLNVYEQVSEDFNNELNRILQSGMSQNEAEVTLRNAGLAAETSTRIAEMGVKAQQDIAILEAATSDRIAQIQQDTTMNGYQRDIAIQQIQSDTQQRVAIINGNYQTEASRIAGMGAAEIEATSREVIASKEIAASMTRLNMQLSQADKELAQRAYEFGVLEVGKDGTPRWLTELNQTTLTENQKIDLARDRLEQEWNQFEITNAEGRRQFDNNLKYMIDNMNVSDAQARDIAAMYIGENSRQFNLTLTKDQNEFAATMSWAKESFGLEDARIREIAGNQLAETVREYDLNYDEGRRQFDGTMSWAKDEFKLTDARIREIATDQLAEQMREFDLTSKDQRDQFTKSLDWAVKQYGMDDKRIRELASAQLIEQAREFNLSAIDQRDQFKETMSWAKEEFNLTDTRIRDIADKQIVEQAREFDITTELDKVKFKETMDWAREEFGMEDKRIRELTQNQLHESIRQYDFTRKDQIEQFDDSIAWAQKEFMLEDSRIRDLQGEAIAEQTREFDVSRQDGLDQWAKTFNMTMEQWGADFKLRTYSFTESLKVQVRQLEGSERQASAQFMLDFLTNPAVVSYMDAEDSQVMGDMIEGITDLAVLGFGSTDEKFQGIINEMIDNVKATQAVEAGQTITVSDVPLPVPGGTTVMYHVYRDKNGFYTAVKPRPVAEKEPETEMISYEGIEYPKNPVYTSG